MITYWLNSSDVLNDIFIPRYYDPTIEDDLAAMAKTHYLLELAKLVEDGVVSVATGDEIGKMAYGTGDIPFVRTSDISNWEIKAAPKQGVSEDIYQSYTKKQDVKVGDILLVKDGTYLIGTNCIITQLDEKIIYQSHLLKLRVGTSDTFNPHLLFLALNSRIVQRQIRSVQFTADTIDTIGKRYLEIVIPIPKKKAVRDRLTEQVVEVLDARERGKAFIKQAPVLMEEVLSTNSVKPIRDYLKLSWEDILASMNQETITAEFGHFETFWCSSGEIKEAIYLPKYYDPEIIDELKKLSKTCDCKSFDELEFEGVIESKTGDEIGKMAYGTGPIPFIRTSDFSNWEIKHDPKQAVSEEIYSQYAGSQDVVVGDILLVRDGTYLVGSSCMITESDEKILYCGGLYKIRVKDQAKLDPWLLLGLLNSYIVKRQIRTKQFTRDVIDTLGKRLGEVVLPIPKSNSVRKAISDEIRNIVMLRIEAREKISELSVKILES